MVTAAVRQLSAECRHRLSREPNCFPAEVSIAVLVWMCATWNPVAAERGPWKKAWNKDQGVETRRQGAQLANQAETLKLRICQFLTGRSVSDK
jgi:hypothetical protein